MEKGRGNRWPISLISPWIIGKFISFHFYISLPKLRTGWTNRKKQHEIGGDRLKIAIVATTRLENAKVVISTANNPHTVYMNETLQASHVFVRYSIKRVQMWKIIQRDEITMILLLALNGPRLSFPRRRLLRQSFQGFKVLDQVSLRNPLKIRGFYSDTTQLNSDEKARWIIYRGWKISHGLKRGWNFKKLFCRFFYTHLKNRNYLNILTKLQTVLYKVLRGILYPVHVGYIKSEANIFQTFLYLCNKI